MRILFLSETFPDAAHPTTGTYNYALCRELARDHEVRVIAPRSWLNVIRGERYRSPATAVKDQLQVCYPTRWYTPFVAQANYGGQMWWSIRKALCELTNDWRPDAVLSYWAHPDGECGLRAGRMFDVPSAVIVGGSDVLLLPRDPRRGACVRQVLTESDAVVTVSDGLRQECMKLGVTPQRVWTIPQGIDPDLFYSGDQSTARSQIGVTVAADESLVVWVGRMVGLKRVDQLIHACRILRDRGRKLRVCLLGDGPSRSEWQQLAVEQGMAEQIQFVGSIGHDRLADWYRAADLTVLCSESEGLPNVLRESVACGTPFVSTDVGSVRELAQPEFSELVPVNHAESLAQGIETVLRGTHSRAARQFQAKTWSATARDTEALFEELIARRRTPVAVAHDLVPSLPSS
ncbi:MAG: glycosyltransferase family 4 protein [Planctomycetota bacterium]|nr:MAG: glycosyltransferase family 4 protein [Planctomycetota bacterium]